MKKLLVWMSMIAIVFTGTFCIGWESGVVRSSTADQNVESSIVSTKKDQITVHKNTKIQARINQVVMHKRITDEYILIEVIVEIENVGREKFKIDSVDWQLISKKGEVIDDTRDYCLSSHRHFSYRYLLASDTKPDVLCPGNIGYSAMVYHYSREGIIEHGFSKGIKITSLEDIDKAEATVRYTQTLRTRYDLPIQNIEITSFCRKGYVFETHVNASIENNTGKSIDNYYVKIALYDKNNRLLGTLGNHYYKDEELIVLQAYEKTELMMQSNAFASIDFDEIKIVKGFCWTYVK